MQIVQSMCTGLYHFYSLERIELVRKVIAMREGILSRGTLLGRETFGIYFGVLMISLLLEVAISSHNQTTLNFTHSSITSSGIEVRPSREDT